MSSSAAGKCSVVGARGRELREPGRGELVPTCAANTLLSPNLRSTPGHLAEKDVLSAESSMLTPRS